MKIPEALRPTIRVLNGPAPLPSTFGIAQSVFIRGLGLIYLIAILSWWSQIDGLVGSNGIVPAASYVQAAKSQLGASAFWHTPSLFLFNASDPALHWVCLIGAVLSVCVIAGIAQGPSLVGLWIVYLSLTTTGNVFMSFQWDALLLETGLLALIFTPWRLWISPRRVSPSVSRWAVILLWFLLFKLMFLSGFVKIASLDRAWWAPELSALTFHYETQPIAHVGGWWAHQLPRWFQQFSVILTYLIEMGLPFLIFLGRRPRLIAFSGFTGLMILIMATGNYTYFNLLTILLCVPLLADSMWPNFVRDRVFRESGGRTDPELKPTLHRVWLGLRLAAGVPLLAISGFILIADVVNGIARISRDDPMATVIRWNPPLAQFHSCNSYGLFRVMTKQRPEIIIEGSNDGRTWLEYGFRWKPDRLNEMPPLVAPHQPRLDWQMWFAALNYQYRPGPRLQWFENLVIRLFQGQPEVQQLLSENPFPNQPPAFIRAKLYDYKFTSPAERRATGNWWKREELGDFLPPTPNPLYRPSSKMSF